MERSNALKNSPSLPAPRAEARLVNNCQTSCAESPRSHAANSSITAERRRISGAVAGVDANVAFREIASPKTRRALAAASNRHPDLAFGPIQLRLQVGLIRSE